VGTPGAGTAGSPRGVAARAGVAAAAGDAGRFAGAAYAFFILIVGTNLPSPLYASYESRFGFSPLVVTLLVAVYAGSVVCALLVAGPLADAIGPRPMVLAGLAIASLGAGLLALAGSTGWLFAARAVQGLAVGTASGALTAALAATVPAGDRARASLLTSASSTAGAGAGPLLAGLVAQFGPVPLRLPYLVELALLVPALAFAARLPEAAGPRRAWRPRVPALPAGARRAFARASAISFLAWAVAYIVLALAPSYVTARVHGAPFLVGGAAAGLLLLGAASAQFALNAWDAARAERVGLALLVAGLAGLVLVGASSSLVLALATITLAGAGQGLAFMGATREAHQAAVPGEEASVAAAYWVVSYLGGGIPVVGVGLLAVHLGLVRAVQIIAAAIALGCLALLFAIRHDRARGDGVPQAR